MITYKEFGSELIEEIYMIYESNGWLSYLNNKPKLIQAFEKSIYVLGAFDNGKLVGFVRCIGDGEYILYIQDLIITPSYHRKGIGRELMKRVSNHYKTIRQFLLITDKDDNISNAFYQSIGLVKECNGFAINHYFRENKKDI